MLTVALRWPGKDCQTQAKAVLADGIGFAATAYLPLRNRMLP